MPRIQYVNDQGDTVEEEILSRRVTFFEGAPSSDNIAVGGNTGVSTIDDAAVSDDTFEFRPAVVERLEYDHEGAMSSLTTVCGETENRRETDEKPRIIVEGIIVEDQVPRLREIQTINEITIISDLFQGLVEIKRVTLEQNTDIIRYIPDNGNEQLAFGFQLQLRQP